jgi:heme/copper-type cytochrome/quinol oxidase subunit 4
MSSLQNPFQSPVSESTYSGKKRHEFRKNLAVLSLSSILAPFVVGVCIERTFGLLSGSQFVLLFGVSIVATLTLGMFVHQSWILKIGWCIVLLIAFVIVAMVFAVATVLVGGWEAT